MKLYRFSRFAVFISLTALLSSARADEPTAPPTEITSQSLEMWSNPDGTETRAIFKGNVTVTGNEIKLTCDRLDILATRIGDKTATIGKLDKFKSLIATGKVHIVQGDREASCGRAEVYPRDEKIVLMDNPVVIDHSGPTVATGDVIEMLRGHRRVTGSNVKITLPALKNLSYDKNSPAPKPDNIPATPAEPAPAAPANPEAK
jgi:lipopolysaccharide export system protein LptA